MVIFEALEEAEIEENAYFGAFLKGLEWAILVPFWPFLAILAISARAKSPKIAQNCQFCWVVGLKLPKLSLFAAAKSEAKSHFWTLSQTLTVSEWLSNVCLDH